jgi:serine/threonine protein kinase
MEPGSRLGNGRYVVRGVLGEGAQGTTYDAVDERENRPVAIKRFDVRGAKSWKDVELAEREARVLATIDHPLVPRYFEHFEENDSLYLVMEKIEGETLEAIRQRGGPLPEAEVRRFLTCADRALSYLHGRSSAIVHRDVKPRNVVRRDDGSYVFVDFGTVSELMSRRGASTVVGTIGYMAPEQLQGRAMPASDVYAVGATALAALTGSDPDTLPHQGLKIDVRRALAGRASEAMVATLERMVEPDPDRRATSVAAALEWSALPAPAAPSAPTSSGATISTASEDGAVKSIGRLLWVLWGLGWVIVPLLVRRFGVSKDNIPLVMFGALACVFVVTWHKGAVIRAFLRAVVGAPALAEAPRVAQTEAAPRQRVDVGEAGNVRVHAGELAPEDLLGETELPAPDARRAQSAKRT